MFGSLDGVEYDPMTGLPIGVPDPTRTEREAFPNRLTRAVIQAPAQAAIGMATLPKRAIEASAQDVGNIGVPGRTELASTGPALETALATMGSGAIAGVPVKGAEAVLGSGPVRAIEHPAHSQALQDAFHAELGPEAGPQAYSDYLASHGAPNAEAANAGGGTGATGRGRSLEEAQAAATRTAGAVKPLEGLPTPTTIVGEDHYVPGPIASVHDVAKQYMESTGRPYARAERYHPLDPEHSTNIAKAFDEMKHAPDDPAVKASYNAMINETRDQYKALEKSGLKIEAIPPGMADPYAQSPRLAAKDVADNNHLWFFPTDQGFGSSAQGGIDLASHPMMQQSGVKLNGQPLLNNDLFRVVHDYFGHLKEGNGFRATGEDNAWRTHANMYSDLARPAMTTETRGQNSWVNYGPHGVTNRKASAADTVYADQKVGLLPDWAMHDPMTLYHASPSRFDRFSSSAPGSGEGSQSFGRGLYFAEKPEVAQSYADKFSGHGQPSYMYQASVRVKPEQFLDLDKSLKEQPAAEAAFKAEFGKNHPFGKMSLGDAIDQAARARGPDAIPNALRDQGVPGVRYLDQGSRGAGDGTRNYVLFDDRLASIKNMEDKSAPARHTPTGWGEVQYVPTSSLKPRPENTAMIEKFKKQDASSQADFEAAYPGEKYEPKPGDMRYKVDELRNAIREGKDTTPLAVHPDGTIEDGENRWMAYKAEGRDKIPVRVATYGKPATPAIAKTKLVDERGLPIQGQAYTKEARRVQDEIAAGPKGAGPLDLSTQRMVPQVEQHPLERYAPPRGISPRMQDVLANPDIQRGVEQSMEAGKGVADWYHTEPVRQAFVKELGPEQGEAAFKRYMDTVAATSPRSDVPTNIRNASYYYAGGDPAGKNPYPYGHVAQNLHKQNVETIAGKGWDPLQNPKPASFAENLRGNLEPVTVDTHAFRNIGMRTGDPRFLETQVQVPYKGGGSEASMAKRFGEVRKGKGVDQVVVYRPQQLVKEGKLTMKEAQKIPTFWAGKPKDNEYAAAENLFRQAGNKIGLRPADAQAAAWSGGGQMTGLGTVGTHTFNELFNERVLFTARMRGQDPKKTLSDFITGKKPLLEIGGAAGGATAFGALSGGREDRM